MTRWSAGRSPGSVRRFAEQGRAALANWLRRFWHGKPPLGGVREPRRPRPTLPAASVALAEPRTALRHRIRQRRSG